MAEKKFRIQSQIFRILQKSEPIDIISYIRNYFEDNPDHKMYLGCDSQNVKDNTVYGIVVVLHKNNKGGHVLYTKVKMRRFSKLEIFNRLHKETEYVLELANWFREENLPEPDFIDLDYNPDPQYDSHQVLAAATGWVTGLGYKTRVKPDSLIASYVADLVCK